MGNPRYVAPGLVFAGRPLPWLLRQALAASTIVASIPVARALLATRGLAMRGERVRLGALLAGTVVFAAWALYWGLLQL